MEKELINVLESMKNNLPHDLYESNIELIEHGEAVIALENLCSQIDDNEIPITKEIYNKIKDIAIGAGLSPDNWQGLDIYIKS
jgi:hypothetical protein